MTHVQTFLQPSQAPAAAKLLVRVIPNPSRRGRAVLIEADGAPFTVIHRAIEAHKEPGLELFLVADASERVAELLRGPRIGGRTCLRLRAPRGDARALETLLRALDLLLGSAILLALLPLIGAIAVAVKATSRGPVFHRALVVGRGGRAFVWRKFRTMRAGAEDGRHRDAARRFISGADHDFRRAGVFKLQRDDRITRLGALIRRHSLDELPQILDVIAGRMSLVGPRPCLPYEWDLYAPHHRERLSVRPGMTGLWQVLGRSRVGFEEMVLLDRCWAWNRSPLLYLGTLARTAGVVLSGRGGY